MKWNDKYDFTSYNPSCLVKKQTLNHHWKLYCRKRYYQRRCRIQSYFCTEKHKRRFRCWKHNYPSPEWFNQYLHSRFSILFLFYWKYSRRRNSRNINSPASKDQRRIKHLCNKFFYWLWISHKIKRNFCLCTELRKRNSFRKSCSAHKHWTFKRLYSRNRIRRWYVQYFFQLQ